MSIYAGIHIKRLVARNVLHIDSINPGTGYVKRTLPFNVTVGDNEKTKKNMKRIAINIDFLQVSGFFKPSFIDEKLLIAITTVTRRPTIVPRPKYV